MTGNIERGGRGDTRQRRAWQKLGSLGIPTAPPLDWDATNQRLELDTADGLEITAGNLAVAAGSGITVDASGVNVNTLTGLFFGGGGGVRTLPVTTASTQTPSDANRVISWVGL